MGDSEGEIHDFEMVQPDIRAAVDQFFQEVPELTKTAIWGLCDAASAATIYAHADPRVSGVVLVNHGTHRNRSSQSPTPSTTTGRELPTVLRKVAAGEFSTSGDPFLRWYDFRGCASAPSCQCGIRPLETNDAATVAGHLPYANGRWPCPPKGRVLLVLCGKDLTAQNSVSRRQPIRWRKLPVRTVCSVTNCRRTIHFPDANGATR
jgi:hypothetical protein